MGVEISREIQETDVSVLIKAAPAPLILLKKGIISEISPSALRILGGEDREKYLNTPFSTIFSPDQRDGRKPEEIISHALSLAQGGDEIIVSMQIIRSDGIATDALFTFVSDSITLSDTLLVGISQEGEIVHELELQGIVRERNRVIFQENPCLMFVLDMNFRIIDSNDAWVRRSGYTSDELIGMNLKDLKVIAKSGEEIEDLLQTKQNVSGEIVFHTPNGAIRLLYQYLPVFSGDEIREIIGVYLDTGEQGRLV